MDANDMTLYDHVLQVIKNNTLISLDLNHPNPFNDESFDLAEIRALSKKVRISSISIVCCHVTEKNIVEFIDVMATLGNCRLNISHGDKYLFTVSDLKMMAEKNIKVTTIFANQLKTDNFSSNLIEFIPVLKQLKHLEKFYYCSDDFADEPRPLHLFKDLPIQEITTNEFKLEQGEVENIVDILTQHR